MSVRNYRHYLVDTITEKIIGSFFANSYDAAIRILKGFDVKKAKLTWNDVAVYRDLTPYIEYETYSELRSLKKKDVDILDLTLLEQPELFEEKSHD